MYTYPSNVTTTQPEQLRTELLLALPYYPSLARVGSSETTFTVTYPEDSYTLTAANKTTIDTVIKAHVPDATYGQTEYKDAQTQLDIVNSAAETTLFSFNIYPGTTSVNGGVLLDISGDYLNNSGSARTFTLRVKLGGVTIYQDNSPNIQPNANKRPWWFTLELWATGDNSQYFIGDFGLGAQGATTSGLGNFGATDVINSTLLGNATGDLSTKLPFVVTIQHSIANATVSFRRRSVSFKRF